MRIDHLAFRVSDRHAVASFLEESFGYHKQAEFEIDFGDGSKAQCIALEPVEKTKAVPWTRMVPLGMGMDMHMQEYHLPPEIFVSDGDPESIVGKWVAARGGVGGLHHIAMQVKSVEETMKLWIEKGWGQFTSDKPMSCPGLTQAFTKPNIMGVIFEFIERGENGFCQANVRSLMESTKNL